MILEKSKRSLRFSYFLHAKELSDEGWIGNVIEGIVNVNCASGWAINPTTVEMIMRLGNRCNPFCAIRNTELNVWRPRRHHLERRQPRINFLRTYLIITNCSKPRNSFEVSEMSRGSIIRHLRFRSERLAIKYIRQGKLRRILGKQEYETDEWQ